MNIRKIGATPSKQLIFDKKGFFTIYLNENQIVVEHFSIISKGSSLSIDTGELDIIITGNNSLTIGQTIIREGLISRIDHGIYVGRELMRAEIALKNNIPYEQCNELIL